MEVEFSTPPQILFNYSETELTNPTIVKNSYSKTITIDGTKQNNKIFGHIYNMQRIQGYNGSIMGSAFNPLVKTDFTLYYNGSIYESGYFKLDEVRRNNNLIQYDISLFGGLGDYLYNLSFREDGTPMELSDLKYEWEVDNDQELGFKINKESVNEAWINLLQPSSKWDTINFAPCYNGIPSNISADKFLICNGVYPFTDSVSGYSVGTSQHEHTEWETFDLRSYLQRPVLRVREVLKACADPRNNGGYTVNFDSDFFKSDNPYYEDSWITLPMLPDLDIPATDSSALTISAITLESNTVLYRLWDGGANATNVQVDVNVNFTPSDSYSGDSVYLYRDYEANGGVTLQSRFVKSFQADSSILVQMLGYNESGQIGAVSNVYRLVSPPEGEYSVDTMPDWMRRMFETTIPATSINGINNVIGKFTKKNGQFVFTDLDGNTQTLRFTFPSDAVFTKLKMKILPQYAFYMKHTFTGGYSKGHGWTELDYWSSRYQYSDSWQDESLVKNLDKVNGSLSYSPVGATGTTTSFEGFFSNRTYAKKDLLTLGVSPAQFLLSYAKAFGLYFIKDVESKEISILSRHNFYKRDEIVNINDLIDKGEDIKITPNSPKYQYYDFAFEQVDSEAAEAYRKTYGNEYGTATVNTGYQYEKEHKALLDGNVFKGGITVMEKNKYFFEPIDGTPQLIWNGFSYTYINGQGETVEQTITPEPMHGTIINPDGLRFYDYMPKLQFHTANNEPSDGSMVLVFCDNIVSGAESCGYKLTDDVTEMYTLNDGQPCWLLSSGTTDASGNTIAIVPNRIPHFTRDIYNQEHYVKNSFDMGTPMTTYVPNTFVSDWQSIYGKSWKSYISDLYDVNTRVLRCRCLLRERPNPDWMRRFYWFDNSYWRLNEIKDWDISSFGTTEMEFIKVQDINNYDSIQYSNCPIVEDRFEQHYIDNTGGTITGIIYVSDGSKLSIAQDGIRVLYSNGTEETWNPQGIVDPIYPYGAINIEITLTIPANTSIYARTITLPIEDECDNFHYVVFTQGGQEASASIQPTSISFTDMGGNQTLTITDTSNHGWTISSSNPWITLSATGGTGSGTVTVTAAANEGSSARTASLVFTDTATSAATNISISQAANIPATISPTGQISVSDTGETVTFTVTDASNHGWTLSDTGTSWIYVSPSSGTGNASVSVTFSQNFTTSARTSSLVFTDGATWASTTISISQAATTISAYVVPTSREFAASGGTKLLNVYDSEYIGWQFTGMPSWITLSETSGSGNAEIDVTPSQNTSSSSRSATLTFTSNGTTTTVTITQEAAVQPTSGDYLTLDIVSGGTLWYYTGSSGYTKPISYSKDDGNTWTTISAHASGDPIRVSVGDKILLKGTNNGYSDFLTSKKVNLKGSAKFNLSGNILSLIYGDNFEGQTTVPSGYQFHMFFKDSGVVNASGLTLPSVVKAYCYMEMFENCTSLTSAPELPVTTLAYMCYANMFNDCTSLTTAPELPATTLGESCYSNMFNGCTSLTTAPELPATTLANGCYKSMFVGCTSLTSAPELPATTLAYMCYANMFRGCTSLTSAPELPATTLANNCYQEMFYGCTSLTSAPELPATTLVTACYYCMFYDCNSINYIKCLATNISARIATSYWVTNVASSGTFVKNANMAGWTSGVDGIPTNWTVVDSGTTPTFNCNLNLTFGNVNIPQDGTWDEYILFYSETETRPAETGDTMAIYSCGTSLYQGNPWNPVDAAYWETYSPFSAVSADDLTKISVPDSLAGKTIYIQAEFGSNDLGYALYSNPVTVQIPSIGGTVNVTIPQF